MAFLNYHHLRYFRAIAMEGSLTKADSADAGGESDPAWGGVTPLV